MVKKTSDLVTKQFDISIIAEQHKKLYLDLLNEKNIEIQ